MLRERNREVKQNASKINTWLQVRESHDQKSVISSTASELHTAMSLCVSKRETKVLG